MTTVRQKILAYLNKARTASAIEISRALKLSAPTVRHHLRILAADGRLERVAVRRQARRGRPETVYGLPLAARGDNLPVLSDALLAEMSARLPVRILAEQLARRLAEGSNFAGQPLAKRLNLAVEKLNRMKYHAHWEAGPEGPRMVLGHCPYAAILAKHPELCSMDENLLSRLVGQSAVQISRVGREESSVCVFVTGR
jgi:DeoR family suf operon transcriptional repressor